MFNVRFDEEIGSLVKLNEEVYFCKMECIIKYIKKGKFSLKWWFIYDLLFGNKVVKFSRGLIVDMEMRIFIFFRFIGMY